MLVHKACQCRAQRAENEKSDPCARTKRHALSHWQAQENSLEQFIFRAVIGSSGLQTNSITQGMLYPILRDEYGLLNVKVGFKKCPHDETKYEGMTCPTCGQPFDPSITPVNAVDWLILQGSEGYVTGPRWWACGGGRQAHYYAQNYCSELMVDNPQRYPKPGFRLRHNSTTHDACPLQSCPRHGNRHPLRGTTLWLRDIGRG
jgi:hypothetical protein